MKQGKRKQFYLWPDVIRWIEKQAKKERKSQSNWLNTLIVQMADAEKKIS